MTDAIVSVVLEQFASYAQHEVGLVVGVREEARKLCVTLRMIKEVLQDAEQKQVKNGAVKIWLEELKGVLYDADDVMDEWNTKRAISQLQRVNASTRKKVLYVLLSPFSCFKHVTMRYAIGRRVKEMGERLAEINTNRSQFGLVVSPSQEQFRPLTSSIMDVSKIHGRDEDNKVMVSWLLGVSSHKETGVQVASIVGMGGFGKTALAQLVFKEEGVVKSFEKRMWVCVSEPFDIFVVSKTIIEEAGEVVPSSIGWEALHQCLSKAVKAKRFLLVLDDVWTNDPSHWEPLKVSLDGGASGSRIIVTTRNEEVAKMIGSSHIHNLEKLSEDDSWFLLRDIALRGREEEYMKFEKTGKEIANKCKGVPLALKTLASLLCVKRSVQNWKDILASEIWDLASVKDFFLPSFFLSYYSLHSVSKQCFLYCAVFPKDTELKKDFLVKLWMAEGFLGSGRMEELEKIGENHFDDLAMRSFFQDFERDSNGNIISSKMHDLVHDFAQYLSQGESSNNPIFDCDKVRYLYWEGIENSSLYKAKKVRTLISNRSYNRFSKRGEIFAELFDMLSCVRVLDLRCADLRELPKAVEKLVHLRYLDLSHTDLSKLPETICNFYNLQTLILNSCDKLEKLPKEIGRLSNLRHLEIKDTDALKYLPESVKRLKSLRTLSKFIVSEGCKIGDLKHFKNLGGALELYGLGGMIEERDVIEADLKEKKDIRSLSFCWEENVDVAAIMGVEKIFERLEPHEDLDELKIRDYPGSQFPLWVHNNILLGNIIKMELSGCRRITQLPALGKLGSLESLKIIGMGSVKSIGEEFYGFDSSLGAEVIAFSKLRTLELSDLKEMENWELPTLLNDTKIMPLLSKLKLERCPKLKALPPWLEKLESLEELDIQLPRWMGVSNYVESMPQEEQVTFSKLQRLSVNGMDNLEQWRLLFGNGVNMTLPSLQHLESRRCPSLNMTMPSLHSLTIEKCPKLKVLPDLTKFKSLSDLRLFNLDSWEGQMEEEEEERGEQHHHSMPDCFIHLYIVGCPKLNNVPSYLFTLKSLYINNCPELSGLQCLPPLLESLWLCGDCGGYLKSISIAANKECFVTRFFLWRHPHSSLPEGFKELKAIKELGFRSCESLDFDLKELQHFTMLQDLDIFHCPILEERFQGDDWRSILPHVPNITINYKEITNRSS